MKPHNPHYQESSSSQISASLSLPQPHNNFYNPLLSSSNELVSYASNFRVKGKDQQKRQMDSEPLELFKTCENTVNQQQLALFQKLNAEHRHHFNHPEIKIEEEPILQRSLRGRRVHKKQNPFTLKVISNHIVNIIANQSKLTVKVLSYILYEIMSETRLGRDIINENYPTINNGILKILVDKYHRQDYLNSDQRSMITNTKRRLYDAINVLIAANIVKRGKTGNLKLYDIDLDRSEHALKKYFLQTTEDIHKTITIENSTEVYYQMRSIEERIKNKRQILQKLHQKASLIDHIVNKNMKRVPEPKEIRFKLPMMLVTNPSKVLMEVESEKVSMRSNSNFQIYSDMDCLTTLTYPNLSKPTKKPPCLLKNQ